MTGAKNNRPTRFLADGASRIRKANRARIEAEVRLAHADQLDRARWWRRLSLRWHMRREIRRRLDEIAPPSALYANSGRSSASE